MQLGGCAWGSQKASNQPDQVKISHKEFKKPCKPNYPFNLMAAIL